MGVGAASGCYPKWAKVDETTVITLAPAARVTALRAADAGKSAAVPGVMCSTKRGGMETSNVTAAFVGLLVGSHRAGGHPGGQREHCAGNNKPSHHRLLRVVRAGPGDCSHRIEMGVGLPRAMATGAKDQKPTEIPVAQKMCQRKMYLQIMNACMGLAIIVALARTSQHRSLFRASENRSRFSTVSSEPALSFRASRPGPIRLCSWIVYSKSPRLTVKICQVSAAKCLPSAGLRPSM
jgi:hypothetical protein